MNLEHFVISVDLAKKKLNLHLSNVIQKRQMAKSQKRKTFTIIKGEHMENTNKMKLKDLDI